MTTEKKTPEKVAVEVAEYFMARWDRFTLRGYEVPCFGRVDVVEVVYDDYGDELDDKELEIAVNAAYKILMMPERQARAAITAAKGVQ